MKLLLTFAILVMTINSMGQYPFEKSVALNYKEYNNWEIIDKSEKENKIQSYITVPAFYSKKDSLTIQLTSFTTNWDSSFIRIYKNKKQLQKIFEPMSLSPNNLYEPARIADINGDNLLDVKLISSYNGCGLAAMNVRVIFLFQNSNGTFTKISFDDKMDENGRVERDFNGDSNFEIITMDLKSYKSHNYWLFNIYNFKNYKLVNVNPSYDYPIMIQYLLRDNYEITNKISRVKMKEFGKKLPDNYDRK